MITNQARTVDEVPHALVKFTQVPNVVLFCPSLSPSARVVYAVLASFDWLENGTRKGYVFPGIESVAQRVGLSSRQVKRHIRDLEKAGLIRSRQRGWRTAIRELVPLSEVDWVALYNRDDV
jgi:hypothetical protein